MLKIQNSCCRTYYYGPMWTRYFTCPEKMCDLPVELVGVGLHYVSHTEYCCDGRGRGKNRGSDERALIQCTVSGTGMVEFEGQRYEIPCGHAMLLTFPENHRYFQAENARHWEALWACFGGEGSAAVIRALRERFGVVVPLRSDGETFRMMRELFEREFPVSFWEASAAGYRLLTTLGKELEQHDENCPRPKFLDAVLDFCRNHAGEPLSVERLAEVAGLSRWHFSREFKRVLGCSVPQYVAETRLQRAYQLLQNSDCSVKEVGAMCGFEGTAYFIRCFAKRFGVTPGAFRDASGAGAPSGNAEK